MSLLSRVLGVITAPRRTFVAIVADPRPAPVLFIVCLFVGTATAAPLFSQRGQAMMARQFDQFEQRSGQTLPAGVKAERLRWGPYLALASPFVLLPAASVVVAALSWAILNMLLAGTATFKQALGIVAHSYVVYALDTIVGAPLMLYTDGMSPVGPFNLGALVPWLPLSSFEGALGASLSALGIWQAVVIGIGLAVLYRVRPLWLSVSLVAAYAAFGAVRAVAFLTTQGQVSG
jgi:hypothetical protein